MKIAIVGAGALGRIYGVRLAARHDVVFVVRSARLRDRSPLRVEHAVPLGAAHEIATPRRVAAIPEDCDAALVTLRFDSIARPDDELRRALAAPPGTLVLCLSPVFHAQRQTLDDLVGHPIVPGMPGVSGYLDDRGVVRHWVPVVAPTLIDDGSARWGATPELARSEAARADVAARERLARALTEARLPARLEPDVEAVDAATTTAFFPMIAAIAVAGSVAALAADRALVDLVVEAGRECAGLARALGRPAPWATLLAAAFRPPLLGTGVALARLAAAEPLRFADLHFGPKLRDQHLLMGEHLVAVAGARRLEVPALRALVERVRGTERGG